jgi:hypothetical protein
VKRKRSKSGTRPLMALSLQHSKADGRACCMQTERFSANSKLWPGNAIK